MKKNILLQFIFKYIFVIGFTLTLYLILGILGHQVLEYELYTIAIITIILYEVIIYLMGNPKNKLANKISKCELRKTHGVSYCAVCPQGYTCANNK
jgi:hypothetical protein